jgi:dephospho-CoA kinase
VPVLGVTGGIASGKTTFTARLLCSLPAKAFDADAEARRLLMSDDSVRQQVIEGFGESIIGEGQIDRSRLKQIIFQDPTRRRHLEQILQPRIRARWSNMVAQHRREKSAEWLIVDIPLLFERGGNELCDRTLVVACSATVQRERVQRHRGATPALADAMIAAQWPMAEKMRRADHVVWNDGRLEELEHEASLAAALLRSLC